MSESIVQLREKVEAIRSLFRSKTSAAKAGVVTGSTARAAIDGLHAEFLGRRSGQLSALMKQLGRFGPEERGQAGQLLNELKQEVESGLEQVADWLKSKTLHEKVQHRIDLSRPGRVPRLGHAHPLSAVREGLEDIFVSMGYEVYEGREVEDDYHCFEALNMPADHPARDMQDTFYVAGGEGAVLRTHTSSAQIRYMLDNPHPPRVRIICPGRVFRRDDDITHSPMFQQIEGLVVGPGIHLGHLKGTIEAFLHATFGPRLPVRFRPSFFPYTEPSVEADLGCAVCDGKGCRVCKNTGWLEILGSGMVHPAVFEAVNARLGHEVYDPDEVTGFAFGLGIERVAMMKHGVDDIRLFYGNDLRFLEQFAR
jgi:phenylalanyl-tRNA synthetase alpha chain